MYRVPSSLRLLQYCLCVVSFATASSSISIGETFAAGWDQRPIVERNIDVPRGGATRRPASEFDQSLYLNWPIYRTPQGQGAFNAAMATLKSSAGPAPSASRFKDCFDLHCKLELPEFDQGGWYPSGRLWVSPKEYILFVKWPRRPPAFVKRRGRRTMRYFVFHEFHNGTGDTDPYDTVSSHNRRIFVPFYLSKTFRDAQGRRFVVLIQVAPYDVRSIHASNRNSAGPGIEVSKNRSDRLQSLQAKAGIVIATMVKRSAPQLRVVHHRGSEGRPMLRAYIERVRTLRTERKRTRITLPFQVAHPRKIRTAKADLVSLIKVPRSFHDKMLGRLFVGGSHGMVPRKDRPPTVNLVRAPRRAQRNRMVNAIAQGSNPASAATAAPLTRFLLASPGFIQLIAPPKRVVPPR